MEDALLTALAQGAAGDSGRQARAALAGLARRGLGPGSPAVPSPGAMPGTSPGDRLIAGLSHGQRDPGLARDPDAWLARTRQILQTAGHSTASTMTGTARSVIQGRDFSGPVIHGDIHLHTPAPDQTPPRQLPPAPVPFVDRTGPTAVSLQCTGAVPAS